MTPQLPSIEFNSEEELQEVCHYLAMRLHMLNRTRMGEQGFAADTGKLLEKLGRAFGEYAKDADIRAAFGSGYSAAKLTRDERQAYLFKLIYDGK